MDLKSTVAAGYAVFAAVSVFLSCLPLSAAQDIPYVRSVSGAAVPGDRPRNVTKTLIFAERQNYGPFQNLLHRYTDRPLFLDTGLRSDPLGGAFAAYRRDVDILVDSGFDGFGSLDYFGPHRRQLKLLEDMPPPAGYSQMFVIPCYFTEKDYPRLKAQIMEAAKSPYTTRLDGRIVFWNYGNGQQGAHGKWARRLNADKELPPFVFIGDIPFLDIHNAYGKYVLGKNPRPIPDEIVTAYRAKVAEAASVMGGFQLWCTEYRNDHFGEYQRRSVATDIYRKYILPAALEAARVHRDRGFLLGTYLRNGYVNPFAGTTDGEYGTATLRAYLDEILLANPDVLMAFEWNEANENTHFQPTIAHGCTWSRVISFYRSLLDRTPPCPRLGDDLSVPNLVVSIRQSLKLGEPWHLELLYLPDGTVGKRLKARASLTDVKGNVLVSFPEEDIDTGSLKAIDYRVPSEHLASHDAVCVKLETEFGSEKKVWTGFDCTRIHPTVSRDYLYSNHPLREMLEPESVKFSVKREADGQYAIEADFKSPEPLSSLEVLEGLQEKAAADPDNRFPRDRFVTVRGRLTSAIASPFGPGTASVLTGKARFVDAEGAVLRAADYAWTPFRVSGGTNGVYDVALTATGGTGTFLAHVPREVASKGTLQMDFKKLGRISCRLSDAVRMGKYSRTFPKSMRLDLEVVNDLADVPPPLGTRAARIRETLPADGKFPVWQMRAVTKSGRIWRSRPILTDPRSGPSRRLTVFSDSERRPVSVEVPADGIPDFRYMFDSRHGAVLPCASDSRFDAQLGAASAYADYAFGARRPRGFPEGCMRFDPEWTTTAEGEGALRFDGKGMRLTLPVEAIPHGAEYTVDFDIMPESDDNQMILRTVDVTGRDVGLSVALEDGTVRVSHIGIKIVPRRFDTRARLNVGAWNRIRVEKRFEEIVCFVNGAASRFPYDRRPRRFAPVIFGGDSSPGPVTPKNAKPFKGMLKSINVRHAVETAVSDASERPTDRKR